MDDYINFEGQMTNTLIVVEKEKDKDTWKGTISVVQGRLPPNGKWENRKIDFSSINKNPEIVTGDLIFTVTKYLESCDGSLFNLEKGDSNVETDSNEIAQ